MLIALAFKVFTQSLKLIYFWSN